MTFKKFISYTPHEKIRSDPFLSRVFYRPLSFLFGYILYRLKISANNVSIFSVFFVFPTCIFFIIGWFKLAMLLAVIFAIADCVDGNLARVEAAEGRLSDSSIGSWLDACSGYVFYAFFPISIGIYSEAQSDLFGIDGLIQIIASLASVTNILVRLMHQKLLNQRSRIIQNELQSHENFMLRFKGEVGFLGFMLPFCFLSYQMELLELFLIFYLSINSIGCLKTYLNTIYRSEN